MYAHLPIQIHSHLPPMLRQPRRSERQSPSQVGNVAPHRRGNINFAAAEPTEDDHLQSQRHSLLYVIINSNSAVLSFIERLSSFRGSQCIKTIGNVIFWDLKQCPLYRGLL